MHRLFMTFLVLTLLAEALAAVSLIGGPGGIADAASATAEPWSMHYGFAVIAIGSTLFWIWPHRTNRAAVTPVLGILLTFHAGVLISLVLAGNQIAGMIIHGVLAVLGLVLFTTRSRWCP